MADIFADGDYKFICAHHSTNKSEMKLKVFKGASLIKENILVDMPTALISLFMDNLQPRVPGSCLKNLNSLSIAQFRKIWFYFLAIALASGSSIYIYKNLRPGFQFTIPSLEVNEIEKDIWARAKEVVIFLIIRALFCTILIVYMKKLGSGRRNSNAWYTGRH